ncbi:hypothetical protein ACFE04_015940 [Oxalis oulophora]
MTDDARIIHAQSLKSPYTDISVYNKLITLYSKTHFLPYSLRLFDHLPSPPTVVSWTALISAHANSDHSLRLLTAMLRRGSVLPNQRALATVLKTCVALPNCLSFGFACHSLALKLGLSVEPYCGSSLINFYSKYCLPYIARRVFDEMPDRDEVCYAAMIVGFAQNRCSIDALTTFAEMRWDNVETTVHSVSGGLRAASDMAAFEQCRILHGHALVTGHDRNVVVGSGLVDGYGKVGFVEYARKVFDENIESMNVVGWNSLMAAYAQQGDKSSVLELFSCMEKDRRFVPDEYSFLAMLSAFCNSGMADECQRWFTRMRDEYKLDPRIEHYTCLVGALGRAGRLEEAESIALKMPFKADTAIWRTLLSTCGHHKEADMARRMSDRLLQLDPMDDSAYVIAANVLSDKGRWDEVAEVRKMMKSRKVKKEGGMSWIEVKGKVHVFLAGDRRHDLTDEIYNKLAEIMESIKKIGYVPCWDQMAHQVGESEKLEVLWHHSEKLAVAFGLVSGGTPRGKALRIVKNLRICKDCHEAFKYIGRVVEREIIVRDANRYHRFLNGNCTCHDIW